MSGPADVLVAHAGKQHAYRHALAVQRAGRLGAFATSGYYRPGRWPDRIAAALPRADIALRRRTLDGLDPDRVDRCWRLELPELVGRAVLGNTDPTADLVHRRDAAFDRRVARRLAGRFPVYWGFQGSCLESLRSAKAAGGLAVAEFATAHVTAAVRILTAEAERHPEWAHTISNLRFPDWYRERLEAEPHAADVCVAASSFTVRSLEEVGVPPERVRVLPLGADVAAFAPAAGGRRVGGRFRVLFVGGVGQRKGIKYLLDAYRRVRGGSTELVLCGPMPAEDAPLKPYRGQFTATGRVDQAEVVRQMHAADVLVLPSVFEGFGLVIAEAMAAGLPVIASTHGAGPELIREGVDGFVLEPDDVDGLADRLTRLMDDPARTAAMGREAARRAADYSWDAHAGRVAGLLASLDAGPPAYDSGEPS